MIKTVRVIGVGSPVSGDMIGIEAVQRLQQEAPWRGRRDIEWVTLERPGAALLSQFAGVATVCLIDALDHPVAGVQRILPAALLAQTGNLSSHDIGVAEALLLAQALGGLPPRLLLYGIAQSTTGGAPGWYRELSEMLAEDLAPAR